MVTQSFAFREPVSDLGQGVFSGPNMLPWKQGAAAYLLQSDAVVMSPATPEKSQKRRRNSPMSIPDQEFRGMYASQLPNGRLSHGSLQSSTLEPCLPADNSNFCDFDMQTLQMDKGGLYSGDLESSCGPARTPHLAYNVAGGEYADRMTNTNPGLAIADPFGTYGNGEFSPHHCAVGGRSTFEAAAAVTAQAFASLQALLNQGGGLDAYSGSEEQVQGSPHVGSAEYYNAHVNTPTYIHPDGADPSSPILFTIPSFGSTATSTGVDLLADYSLSPGENFAKAFAPVPSSGNFERNGQMSAGPNVCDTSWDLTSQASVSNAASHHHHHHPLSTSLGLVSPHDGPGAPQTTPCPPPLQPKNARVHLSQQAYMQAAAASTPEKNHDGRRLSYVATPHQSPNHEYHHAFEATTPQQAATQQVHVYLSGVSQPVESVAQGTVDSAVSDTTEAIEEDPQQERFSQTYEPPSIAAEVDNGRKEGYNFDLNEVPGANESTPKTRKKYHPRVAKDKRTYKPRANKTENKTDGSRRMDSVLAPDGISPEDTSADRIGAAAGLKRDHTKYNMTNGEGRDASHPDVDADIEFGNVGMGFTPATPISLEKTSSFVNNSRYTHHQITPEDHDHLSPQANNKPFNMGHDTAVCDCEACIHSRLERRTTGKGSRTRLQDEQSAAAQAPHVVEASPVWEQQHSTDTHWSYSTHSLNAAEISLTGSAPVQLLSSGSGRDYEERPSVEVWNDGTDFFRESTLQRSSSSVPTTDHAGVRSSFFNQLGATSAVATALDNLSESSASVELSFMEQSNSHSNRQPSRRRSFFNQTFTSEVNEGYNSTHNYYSASGGDSPRVRGDSYSAHSPLLQQQAYHGRSDHHALGAMRGHSIGGQEMGGVGNHTNSAYPRPVRRSLMAQFTPPAAALAPEERSLSSFGGSGFDARSVNDIAMTRFRAGYGANNNLARAMVSHHREAAAYIGVRPGYFDQAPATPPRSSCLQQFTEAAAERGLLTTATSYGHGTEHLMRSMRDMVTRRRDNRLFAEKHSTLFQQLDSPRNAAISSSYGEQAGAIVPANAIFQWNPDFPYHILPTRRNNNNSSFMSRLCPRGILSPQNTPFRLMTRIQRVVYLKTILMSHKLETPPIRLLHHVQEHLPETEKDAFELLWPLILEPVTKEQMQQLTELAETEVMSNNSMEITEYQADKRKQRPKKASSKKGLQMAKAMTLWPDLMEQQTPSKPSKEKREKGGPERQNSDGISSQGLELVPYQGRAMVAYDGPFLPLRKRKPRPKVVLDTETVRVWKQLMGKTTGPMDTDTDANKELKWEEERRIMKAQADTFIKRMHLVQGDRSFSRWKGSVVDSVVGAFLTQNVNDVLSSSAFMCMRARFPGRGFRGPLQSKAPEDINCQPLENEAGSSTPPPFQRLHQEPQVGGFQEASSYGATTGHIVSAESRPNSLESQESRNEESFTTHLEVNRQSEDSMSTWLEGPGHQQQQQQQHQMTSTHTALSQTAVDTAASVNTVSERDSALDFHILTSTEHTATEESTGANIDTQLDLLSLQVQDKNDVRDLATENDVGSELVPGNQHETKGKYNPKGLTGLERARLEEKQVSARKSFDWEALRDEFKPRGPGEDPPAAPPRTELTEDGVDWEAVRRADVEEVAAVIKERGLNWILAGRIKAFLERITIEHGAIDLEWLRSIPTDDTKEFLLSIRGLGLKSVECIRLLTLHHLAFPVDTNVGRICVRLGWVPLEPLPEELQLHLLELYPVQATIQKYLWPRLCTLDQQTLYELHYQMITFGKVFCTKSKPNCNACPMRSECKHFASALSSAKLALPASERPNNGPTLALPPGTTSIVESSEAAEAAAGGEEGPPVRRSMAVSQYCQPIVEEPMTPESEADVSDYDIEDYPFAIEEVEDDSMMNLYIQESSNTGVVQQQVVDIPNCCSTSNLSATISEASEPVQEMIMEDWGGLAMPSSQMTSSHLNSDQDSSPNTAIKIVESNEVDQESPGISQSTAILVPDAPSQELVLVPPEAASIPVPKLKNIGRLRTVHYVYELPDNHPLLEGMDTREEDDPCCYLLAIWSPGEVPESIPNINDNINEENPFASSNCEGEAESIKATLLVPCRTAMQGSFPLNGTYFQVNEVFADHASSLQPIIVPRTLLWNLRRRFVFFGTSVTSIFRGMTVEEIQACFWRGYVCVRGFDRTTRAPKPLVGRLHLQASKSATGGKGAPMDAN